MDPLRSAGSTGGTTQTVAAGPPPPVQEAQTATVRGDQGVDGARAANTRLGQGWSGVASDYQTRFGNQSYVKNGSDPQLLDMLGQVLAKHPELESTKLGQAVRSGKVGPEDMKELQSFLQSKGLSVGPPGVDGKYGPLTHNAVERLLRGESGPPIQSGAGQTGAAGTGATQTGAPASGTAQDGPPQNETPQPQNDPSREQPAGETRPPGEANNSGQKTGAPPGFAPIRGQVPQGVSEKAKSLLGGDYGAETPFEIDGVRYMARVEHHYHPPGYQGGPNGWHKGVTVYRAQ